MNRHLTQRLAAVALAEMSAKLDAYEKRPDANTVYLMKNRDYLKAIKDYISLLEGAEHDLQFNKEFLIVTEQSNDTTRIKYLEQKISDLQQLLTLRGIDTTDQAYLLQDIKEITRANSITKAREIWNF